MSAAHLNTTAAHINTSPPSPTLLRIYTPRTLIPQPRSCRPPPLQRGSESSLLHRSVRGAPMSLLLGGRAVAVGRGRAGRRRGARHPCGSRRASAAVVGMATRPPSAAVVGVAKRPTSAAVVGRDHRARRQIDFFCLCMDLLVICDEFLIFCT
jgi:hypothetical protein